MNVVSKVIQPKREQFAKLCFEIHDDHQLSKFAIRKNSMDLSKAHLSVARN